MPLYVMGSLPCQWVLAAAARTAAAGGRAPEQPIDPARAAPALGLALLVGFLLALVLLLGTFVLVRALRRFRLASARTRRKETPVDDVWAMHKPPPDIDLDGWEESDSDH